jgi:hypothetical protein
VGAAVVVVNWCQRLVVASCQVRWGLTVWDCQLEALVAVVVGVSQPSRLCHDLFLAFLLEVGPYCFHRHLQLQMVEWWVELPEMAEEG